MAGRHNFVSILEEAAGAAIPGTAAAFDEVRGRLEQIREDWQGGSAELTEEELRRLKAGLEQVRRLMEHAARRRLGLMRVVTAEEMGYTARGGPAAPTATSFECVG